MSHEPEHSVPEPFVVVVIRAWRESNGFRARLIIGAGEDGSPRECSRTTVDAVIDALRDVLGPLESLGPP